jgi:hypothetical protein
MQVRITQFGDRGRTFDSVEEYERFLRESKDELVHLQEYVKLDDRSFWTHVRDTGQVPELDAMWERIMADAQEGGE